MNYNQYHGLKPKYSKELLLNPRLMKEDKLRKHKSGFTESKKLLEKGIQIYN